MIITRSWLQEWIDISEIPTENILKALNSIGLEVDNYKNINLPKKIVIGYVKSRVKHDNSDRLSICEVDVGSEVLQIVCGAKNVDAGQYVCVSLIGAKLPNGLIIKKSKIRGVESFGMICSSDELGLAKINDGILVLDESIGKLDIGREICEYKTLNDEVIEIDLTPNRGDCLSIYGVARDLSAALDLALKKPIYEVDDNLLGIGRVISIHSNEIKNCAFQYRAFDLAEKSLSIDLVKKLRLAYANIKKDSVLDSILAYTTHSTGVLLRAYDFTKICEICSKIALNIKEEKEGHFGVYIDDKCLSLAGISQLKAKVGKECKTVLIEANYTEPNIISKAVGINKELKGDDHLYRSTRGSEPDLSIGGDFLFLILSKMSGINLYAGYQQIMPHRENKIVSFSVSDINAMIGKDIDKNEMVKILKKLYFNINVTDNLINVEVPFFRHDIENVHDVCEEIVRIIGIDNIDSTPLIFKEQNRLNDVYKEFENRVDIRKRASNNGFFESIHYVFDSKSEILNLGFKLSKKSVLNPINNELDILRPTLINHLMKSCARNIKNSKRSVKLFELGTIFDENLKESDSLGFIASGLIGESSLLYSAKPKEVDFIYFANLIQNIIGKFECEVPSKKIKFLSEFEQAHLIQNGKKIGYIGRVDLTLEQSFDLLKSYVCEIEFDKLEFGKKVAKEYSKMPLISRDLSLVVKDELAYKNIKNAIDELKIPLLKEHNIIDIYKDEKLKDNRSITIKFAFQSMDKTLEDSDINEEMEKITKHLNEKFGVSLR